jgi:hypothetical protein
LFGGIGKNLLARLNINIFSQLGWHRHQDRSTNRSTTFSFTLPRSGGNKKIHQKGSAKSLHQANLVNLITKLNLAADLADVNLAWF